MEVISSIIGGLTVGALFVGLREVMAACSKRSRFEEEELDVRIGVEFQEMVCPVVKEYRAAAAADLIFPVDSSIALLLR